MSPVPPTSNTLSSQQRSVLVRSAQKLSKILGDVPRVFDDEPISAAGASRDPESAWRKRKPTHLPPLIKPPTPSIDGPDVPDSPTSPLSPIYNCPPAHRGSVLSIAPSIVSNAPSSASGSSLSMESTQRRLKMEHVRRKLGHEVPATAVFPSSSSSTPLTPRTAKPAHRGHARSRSRSRSRPAARPNGQTDDGRSVTFSISSDESVHTVTFSAARASSPRHKQKHVYLTGPLPPVPAIPPHLTSSSSRRANEGDDAGLIRSRQKMAAGSRVGGSDFKAARRAKREGRALNGMAEPGELVEMVGFLF